MKLLWAAWTASDGGVGCCFGGVECVCGGGEVGGGGSGFY